MRILGREDVRGALPMATAVECMKQAFASLSRGDATVPPRTQLASWIPTAVAARELPAVGLRS